MNECVPQNKLKNMKTISSSNKTHYSIKTQFLIVSYTKTITQISKTLR